jgi:ribosomal protein L14
MIHCKELNIDYATKKEMYSALVENKDILIAQKKAIKKEVDCGVVVNPIVVRDKQAANKQEGDIIDPINLNELKVVVIINTTNFLDKHGDVHIPGLWSKSLSENKMIMHLQEHEMEFDKIIADGEQLKAYTKTYTWAELGYSHEGMTEGLTFESTILRKRNEFMLNQYANGWVKNHSVGMYYVKMDFAINDEDYPNEFEAWNKYYPQIANKEVADDKGYFWYVLEAKVIEGSAVPIGSNSATPTLDNGMKSEPLKNTQKNIEPLEDTQKGIDYNYLRQNLKLK